MQYSLQNLIANVELASTSANNEADLIAAVEVCAANAVACKEVWFDQRFQEADEEQGYRRAPSYGVASAMDWRESSKFSIG